MVVLAAVALWASWTFVPAPATAQTGDSTTSTDLSTPSGADTTSDNPLLVEGPQPEAQPTQADEVDQAPTADEPVDSATTEGTTNDEAEQRVRLVMYALVGVAVALALLTVYYWWRTRPPRRGTTRADRRATGADEVPSSTSEDDDGDDVGRRPEDSAAGTVDPWQTDSTSTR